MTEQSCCIDPAAARSFGTATAPPILSHGLINRGLMIGDILCFLLAGGVAGRASDPAMLLQSMALSMLGFYAYRWISGNRRIYRWDRYSSVKWEVIDILGGMSAATAVVWLLGWIFRPDSDISEWFVWWLASGLASVLALHLGTRWLVRRLQRRGALYHRVAVIGAGPEGAMVVERLLDQSSQRNRYQIVGIFDERACRHKPQIEGIPVTRGIDPLIQLAQTTPVDAIVVALPVSARHRLVSTVSRIRVLPADVLLLVNGGGLNVKQVHVRNLEGQAFLQLAKRPLIGSGALIKLVEDYAVAALAILLTAPIMLAVCLAIRLEGPGPILFRQTRVGFNNRHFQVLKFRSMAVSKWEDDGRLGTRENDPRLTRVGRFIRKYSIDELPQFFNVLKGEMSVIGPRAHVPEMLVGNASYREMVEEYNFRHRVKPGITGWAQINGMRGGIHNEEKARRGAKLDLEYIENWSLWFDLRILVRTVSSGLWGRNVF